jgi:signal transduction histidine kinase
LWRRAEQTALLALATDESEPANTLVLYEILAKVYARLGDSNKVWTYIDKHNALQSSWATKHYQSSIREMKVKYETEKKSIEIERQQSVIAHQNMQRLLLAGGVALCFVILVLLWVMLRLRNRRNIFLLQHNDALAEMNATKDKFFSIISHDLKNPAIAQRNAIQMLVNNGRSWDTETLADYCNELLHSADGMVDLIYNMLRWAQVQTGRIAYTPDTFIFSERLPDIALIRKMAEDKGIHLVVTIPNHASVTADSNILATVVRNLLTNAVKFTTSGGTVHFSIEPSGEGKYTVAVIDTGIGMSKKQINNLFRIESAYSGKGTVGEQGSGLGLIVCRELLEKHGSVLHIESEEGKGSRFWFEV